MDVRERIDTEGLTVWLNGRLPGGGEPLSVSSLDAHSPLQSFLLIRGESRWLLRCPARGASAEVREAVRREAQLLSALKASEIPHPAFIALCADRGVIGREFSLSEAPSGVRIEDPLPDPYAYDSHARRALSFEMTRVLALIA